MAETAKLSIVLEAEDKASKVLKEVGTTLSNMQPIFKTMATVGTVAFGALTTEIVLATKAAGEAEAKMASFNATMDAIGNVSSKTRQQLIDAGNAARKLGFDNEATTVVLGRFYQRTNDVTEATKLNAVAMDLARAKNLDLESAANLVNQALSGNGRALKQYGIEISDSLGPLEALGVLHDKVKGQATAFADTYEGKMQILQGTLGELQESIGTAFLPIMKEVIDKITPVIGKIEEWATKNPDLTAKIFIMATAIAALVGGLGLIGLALPAIIAGFTLLVNPITIAIGLVSALAGWFVYLWNNVDKVRESLENLINTIKRYVSTAAGSFANGLNNALGGSVGAGAQLNGSALGGGSLSVQDAIISPDGRIITTSPEDYLIATKDPGSLTGGLVVNINGGTYLSEDAAGKLGDMILNQLRLNMRV